MSAFMVTDITIDIVVNWLRSVIEELTLIPARLKEVGVDTSIPGWEEILGHEMFQLNIKAVDARYGSGEAKKFRPLDYHYKQIEPIPMMQVLKSLQCWLYQCCEGEVPKTALYKLFDTDIQVYLMSEIIETLPEYQNAIWG